MSNLLKEIMKQPTLKQGRAAFAAWNTLPLFPGPLAPARLWPEIAEGIAAAIAYKEGRARADEANAPTYSGEDGRRLAVAIEALAEKARTYLRRVEEGACCGGSEGEACELQDADLAGDYARLIVWVRHTPEKL